MLKKKFTTIIIIATFILSFIAPIVRADDEPASGDPNFQPNLISENGEENLGSLEMNAEANTQVNESTKEDDVYLFGDSVVIDYVVDGNLFVFANNVTISSQVGGDAFICAKTLTVGENAYIFSNLFAVAENVQINGVVHDVYVASNSAKISGYIYRDARIGADTITLAGTVGRNAFFGCKNLNFEFIQNDSEQTGGNIASSASIKGNLTYSSEKEISIPDGVVSGETKFNKESDTPNNTNMLQKTILSLGTFLATVSIVWLLCLWKKPKFFEKASDYLLNTKKLLPVIGFGVLTPVVAIIAIILLFILNITSTVAILLILLLIALMIISNSVFTVCVNQIVCDKLKIDKTSIKYGILLACALVIWLVSLIPVLGGLIGYIVFALGLGIIVSNLVLKDK